MKTTLSSSNRAGSASTRSTEANAAPQVREMGSQTDSIVSTFEDMRHKPVSPQRKTDIRKSVLSSIQEAAEDPDLAAFSSGTLQGRLSEFPNGKVGIEESIFPFGIDRKGKKINILSQMKSLNLKNSDARGYLDKILTKRTQKYSGLFGRLNYFRKYLNPFSGSFRTYEKNLSFMKAEKASYSEWHKEWNDG